MVIHSAQFLKSSPNLKQCPPADLPEYAFIGRSNVGKSSLINMLTGNKNLAKTSSKPGKTRLINHFVINDSWYLVDLPGYGWAQASKTAKREWGKNTRDYLLNRSNLFGVFVLIDSRLEPQKIDLEFIHWLGEDEIPIILVFTKTDKLSSNTTQRNIALMKKTLLQTWEELPVIFSTSAMEKTGRKELLNFIDGINQKR